MKYLKAGEGLVVTSMQKVSIIRRERLPFQNIMGDMGRSCFYCFYQTIR